jgi:hypothetical protein
MVVVSGDRLAARWEAAVIQQGNQSLIDRMIGAARLDVHTYEAVERDINATTQAALIVIIAAIASGLTGTGGGVLG